MWKRAYHGELLIWKASRWGKLQREEHSQTPASLFFGLKLRPLSQGLPQRIWEAAWLSVGLEIVSVSVFSVVNFNYKNMCAMFSATFLCNCKLRFWGVCVWVKCKKVFAKYFCYSFVYTLLVYFTRFFPLEQMFGNMYNQTEWKMVNVSNWSVLCRKITKKVGESFAVGISPCPVTQAFRKKTNFKAGPPLIWVSGHFWLFCTMI